MSGVEVFVTTIGMAIVALLCRSAFLLSEREVPMPNWLREGLRYAPIAALAAVIAPEVVLTQGELIASWRDARLFGALAGLLYYAWRRGLFGTIVCGTGVMLALRLGLGW